MDDIYKGNNLDAFIDAVGQYNGFYEPNHVFTSNTKYKDAIRTNSKQQTVCQRAC